MIILGIVLIIFTICLIYFFKEECCDGYDALTGTLLYILLIVVCVGFSALVSIGVNASIDQDNKTYEISDTYEIIALKDNQGIEGHYYLFGGYSEDKLQYYYAQKTENGTKISKVAATDCYVIYTKDTPKIEVWSSVGGFKHWYHYIYAFPINSIEYYKVYVPEGTVTTNEYKIDLE